MTISPVVLLVASVALTAFSTVAQIMASRSQNRAIRNEANFEAAIIRNNQIIAERAAGDAIERGRIAEGIKRSEIVQLIGIQRAALAGSGIEVDTGSALAVTTDTAGIGEFEAQVIRANAEREAFDLRVQAANLGAEAQLTALRGHRPDQTASIALSGASSILGSFANFGAAGGFDPPAAGGGGSNIIT